MSIIESTFEATVADVKNGKTKLVIKFDAEEIEREELANLNDMIGTNVEVTVKARAVIIKEEEQTKGKEYSVNGRGEVDVAPGQTNIDDYIETDYEVIDESEQSEVEEEDQEHDQSAEEVEEVLEEASDEVPETEEPSKEQSDSIYEAI